MLVIMINPESFLSQDCAIPHTSMKLSTIVKVAKPMIF